MVAFVKLICANYLILSSIHKNLMTIMYMFIVIHLGSSMISPNDITTAAYFICVNLLQNFVPPDGIRARPLFRPSSVHLPAPDGSIFLIADYPHLSD